MAISLEELKSLKAKKSQRHKFNAVRCERDGKRFPSKLERAFFDKISVLKKTGEVLWFIRQVPFDLPGNIVYRLDFMIFWANEDFTFVETKGNI